MPPLQVKDCPQDVYDQLKMYAARDNRNLTQQMLAIFKWYIAAQEIGDLRSCAREKACDQASCEVAAGLSLYAEQPDSMRIARRKSVFGRIEQYACYSPSSDQKNAADLLRECREEAR